MGNNQNYNNTRRCNCKQSLRRKRSPGPQKSSSYECRVCHKSHPLKICGKFLAMNISQRLEIIRKHRYCINCLAHKHSSGRCSSKARCKHCKKFHHTLIHVNPRLKKELLSSASSSSLSRKITQPVRNSSPKPSMKEQTLSSLIRPNEYILLPTVCVLIEPSGKESYTARCLLNTGTPHSKIHGPLAEKLHFMRYTLDDETLCPLKLQSVYDESSFLEHTFRVDDIQVRTPTNSLPPSIKAHYRNLSLADSNFYVSDTIDIILGMDVYKKVIIPGDISKPGLPEATNTIFGYSINGSFAS